MKLFYCGLLLLCTYAVMAQPLAPGLGIGDAVPSVKSSKVLNSLTSSFSSTAYKGKLLVLDFMRTTCSGCLSKLDHYAELQQQFKTNLAIILVTPESPAVVKSYMKRPKARPLRFPIITADQELEKLFPHESLSHLVWIDSSGKVKAITEGDWLTAENISSALQPGVLPWPVKRDVPFFDYSESLVKPGDQATIFNGHLSSFGALLPYLSDVPPHFSVSIDTSKSSITWRFFNQSIIELYTRIYNQPHWPLSRIGVPEDNQPYAYVESSGPRRAWQENYALNCELQVPFKGDIATARRRARQQLDALLGLSTGFERKKVQCLVIRSNGKPSVPPVKEGIILWTIAEILNNRFNEKPVMVDHDSLTYMPVAIKSEEVANAAILMERLREAGFEFVPETRELEMFIINKNSLPN